MLGFLRLQTRLSGLVACTGFDARCARCEHLRSQGCSCRALLSFGRPCHRAAARRLFGSRVLGTDLRVCRCDFTSSLRRSSVMRLTGYHSTQGGRTRSDCESLCDRSEAALDTAHHVRSLRRAANAFTASSLFPLNHIAAKSPLSRMAVHDHCTFSA